MTEYVESERARSGRSPAGSAYADQSGWVGWIGFAGIMMVLLGTFHAIEGLVGIFNDGFYVVGKSGLVVSADYTAWGWTHLIYGLIVVAAGVSLFAGRMWARIVGVLLALVSAVVNMAFLAAYPFWSAIMILIDVLVIWAITVHGSEVKA